MSQKSGRRTWNPYEFIKEKARRSRGGGRGNTSQKKNWISVHGGTGKKRN